LSHAPSPPTALLKITEVHTELLFMHIIPIHICCHRN
jgi:hypothetical protein